MRGLRDDDELDDEPRPEPTRFTLLDGLQVVFAVAGCSGLFFALNGPAKNEAHALFRIGIMVVGVVGLGVVSIIKFSRSRRG